MILGRLASARNAALLAVLALGLASVPLWAPRFWIYVATQALIFAVFAMSLDLLLGYAGLPSLRHAAFYGVGAYACAPTARLVTYSDLDRVEDRQEAIYKELLALLENPFYDTAAVNMRALQEFSSEALAGKLAGVLDRVQKT